MQVSIFLFRVIFSQETYEMLQIWRDSAKQLLLCKDYKEEYNLFKDELIRFKSYDVRDLKMFKSLINYFEKAAPANKILEDVNKFKESVKIIDKITDIDVYTIILEIIEYFKSVSVKSINELISKSCRMESEFTTFNGEHLSKELESFCETIENVMNDFNNDLKVCRNDIILVTSHMYFDVIVNSYDEQTLHDEKYECEYIIVSEIIENLFSSYFGGKLETLDSIVKTKDLVKVFNTYTTKYLKEEFNHYLVNFTFTSDYFLKKIQEIIKSKNENIQKIELEIPEQAAKISDKEVEEKYTKEIDVKINELNTKIQENLDEVLEIFRGNFFTEEYFEVRFSFHYISPNSYLKEELVKIEDKLKKALEKLARLKTISNALYNEFNEQKTYIKGIDECFHVQLERIFIKRVKALYTKVQQTEISEFFVFFEVNEFTKIHQFLEKMERRIKYQKCEAQGKINKYFTILVVSGGVCLCGFIICFILRRNKGL